MDLVEQRAEETLIIRNLKNFIWSVYHSLGNEPIFWTVILLHQARVGVNAKLWTEGYLQQRCYYSAIFFLVNIKYRNTYPNPTTLERGVMKTFTHTRLLMFPHPDATVS